MKNKEKQAGNLSYQKDNPGNTKYGHAANDSNYKGDFTEQGAKGNRRVSQGTIPRSKHRIHFTPATLKYAIPAGATLSLYEIIVQLAAGDYAPYLSFFAYALLLGFVFVMLKNLKSIVPSNKFFRNGFVAGAYFSFFTAITFVVVNIISYALGADVTYTKFGLGDSEAGNFALVSGMYFFETMVMGMIATFICLQGLKTSARPS